LDAYEKKKDLTPYPPRQRKKTCPAEPTLSIVSNVKA
jgi:hypothetical protein